MNFFQTMMKFLRAPAPLIINVVKWVLCLLIGTMCICVFAQVLYRKILSGAIPWSEELARYLFVWSAWLGSAVALYRHSHFGVDMVVKIMPEFLRKATHVIVLIIGAAFFVIAIWKGFELSFNNWYQKSPAMRIPMTFAYLSVPVGSMLMLYFWITNSSKER